MKINKIMFQIENLFRQVFIKNKIIKNLKPIKQKNRLLIEVINKTKIIKLVQKFRLVWLKNNDMNFLFILKIVN